MAARPDPGARRPVGADPLWLVERGAKRHSHTARRVDGRAGPGSVTFASDMPTIEVPIGMPADQQRDGNLADAGHRSAAVAVLPPVFVDRSGRRRRLMIGAGLTSAAVLLLSLAVLGVGFMMSAPLPLPEWAEIGRRESGPATGGTRSGADVTPPSPTPKQAGPSTASARPTNQAGSAGNNPVRPTAANSTAVADTAASDPPGQGAEHRAEKANKSPGRRR